MAGRTASGHRGRSRRHQRVQQSSRPRSLAKATARWLIAVLRGRRPSRRRSRRGPRAGRSGHSRSPIARAAARRAAVRPPSKTSSWPSGQARPACARSCAVRAAAPTWPRADPRPSSSPRRNRGPRGLGPVGGIDARRAVQRVDHDPGIVGQRRQTGAGAAAWALIRALPTKVVFGLLRLGQAQCAGRDDLDAQAAPAARRSPRSLPALWRAPPPAGRRSKPRIMPPPRSAPRPVARRRFSARSSSATHLVAAEGRAFGRHLHLDQPAVAGHDEIAIGRRPRCPRDSRGPAPPARHRSRRTPRRHWSISGSLTMIARLHQLVHRQPQRHPAAGDRGAAGAAIGLDHVAIDRRSAARPAPPGPCPARSDRPISR